MNKKDKQVFIIILIVFALVVGVAAFVFRDQLFRSAPVQPPQDTVQVDTTSETYQQYAALSGEEYDRIFIANMIAHHQGAVDMANLALENAKHQELKDMANDIILAQGDEMNKMESWQKEWGYPPTSADSMMDHSAMSMINDMAWMTSGLDGKVGDDFDKAFVEQMIIHHQSAIDMAAPGEKNAQHKELKNLTKEVVAAQTNEVQQMKSWQKEWGYVTE